MARIKQNIAHLHALILGETHALSSTELNASYQLFLATWQEGNALLTEEQTSKNLPGRCQVHFHPDYPTMHDPEDATKLQPLQNEVKVIQDHRYVIRSWMAVVNYLTSDYRFVYE